MSDKFVQANIDISELADLRTRLAEVERERDELRKERFAFGVLQESQAQAALRSQLTQAREALERIASMSPSVEQRGWVIAVDIASQALATTNREGETDGR